MQSTDPVDIYHWVMGYVGNTSFGQGRSLDGIRMAYASGTGSLIRTEEAALAPLRLAVFAILAVIALLIPFRRSLWSRNRLPELSQAVFPSLVGLGLIVWWNPVIEGQW